ncbi:hypothetical protein BU23DRAFT_563643 [Bimuria novae-zelandiae CBS 107.79]|uniref:Uncharacterized protein n=1 Tax=Bimuria novae-zelandiae CBS 107.79 TaxID=1447943 RepID=A0A6A5W025_9PLEO|nr:hypothetical protein BU23DRAFT_563643 [Bimuria novae-zelandiae CBS 107.79]
MGLWMCCVALCLCYVAFRSVTLKDYCDALRCATVRSWLLVVALQLGREMVATPQNHYRRVSHLSEGDAEYCLRRLPSNITVTETSDPSHPDHKNNLPNYNPTTPHSWPFITEKDFPEGLYDGSFPLPQQWAYSPDIFATFFRAFEDMMREDRLKSFRSYPLNLKPDGTLQERSIALTVSTIDPRSQVLAGEKSSINKVQSNSQRKVHGMIPVQTPGYPWNANEALDDRITDEPQCNEKVSMECSEDPSTSVQTVNEHPDQDGKRKASTPEVDPPAKKHRQELILPTEINDTFENGADVAEPDRVGSMFSDSITMVAYNEQVQ